MLVDVIIFQIFASYAGKARGMHINLHDVMRKCGQNNMVRIEWRYVHTSVYSAMFNAHVINLGRKCV